MVELCDIMHPATTTATATRYRMPDQPLGGFWWLLQSLY
jgi:hypothetical protein